MMLSPCNPSLPAALLLHPSSMCPVSHSASHLCTPGTARSSSLRVPADRTVAMLTVTATPGHSGAARAAAPAWHSRCDGCSQRLHILHIQRLRWEQGRDPGHPSSQLQGALPGASRSVGARGCFLLVSVGLGRGHGAQVCQSRAEVPWAQCHPRPAVGKIRRPLSPRLRCQPWAQRSPLIRPRVPLATPHRAGTPLPRWL